MSHDGQDPDLRIEGVTGTRSEHPAPSTVPGRHERSPLECRADGQRLTRKGESGADVRRGLRTLYLLGVIAILLCCGAIALGAYLLVHP